MDLEEGSMSTRADIGNDAIVIGLIIASIAIAYTAFSYLDKQWNTGEETTIV
jgi:hypothetical protein